MVPANVKLFLCQTPVRMHCSFEGLSAIVEQMFSGELLSGAFFIFLSRRKDHMKVLFWDGDGFVIYYKRLEKGTFATGKEDSPLIDRRRFLMILEGVTPRRLQPRFFL